MSQTTLSGKLNNWLERVIATLFALVVVIGSLQTFSRYALNFTFFWVEELIRYLCIWMILLAAAVAVRRGAHTNVDIVLIHLPLQLKAPLAFFIYACTLIFSAFLVHGGITLARSNMTQLSPALRVPIGLAYAAIPVAGVLMILYTLRAIFTPMSHEGE